MFPLSQNFTISTKCESKGLYYNSTCNVFYECAIHKLLRRDESLRGKNHVQSKSCLRALDCNQESSDHLTKSAGNKYTLNFVIFHLKDDLLYNSVLLYSEGFDLQSGCFPTYAMIPEEKINYVHKCICISYINVTIHTSTQNKQIQRSL